MVAKALSSGTPVFAREHVERTSQAGKGQRGIERGFFPGEALAHPEDGEPLRRWCRGLGYFGESPVAALFVGSALFAFFVRSDAGK